MSDSMFDAQSFLGSAQVQGASATKVLLLPVGFECNAVITEIDAAGGWSDKMNDGEGGHWAALKIFWETDDPQALEITKKNKVIVKQEIFLDMTKDGAIAQGEGVNIRLGRLRQALNQNDPNSVWSPNMLVGSAARIVVGQEVDNRDEELPADEQRKYNTVTAVSSIS